MLLESCRLMTGLQFITTLIFKTFHISWLLLFTVPWTCPVVGKNTTKTLVYFPDRGASCLPACSWLVSAVALTAVHQVLLTVLLQAVCNLATWR